MGLIYVSAINMCLENILEAPLNRLLFFFTFYFFSLSSLSFSTREI